MNIKKQVVSSEDPVMGLRRTYRANDPVATHNAIGKTVSEPITKKNLVIEDIIFSSLYKDIF